MTYRNKTYFTSDFHLGLKAITEPLEREKRIVSWLEEIAPTAKEIFLLGDIFDFWWEYKKVVPKGFTRFLGTISKMTDDGIKVHFFTGNHDMWIRDYLSTECGMITHTEPYTTVIDGKKFFLAHGDGLGTSDWKYKILLAIFHNKLLRKLYSLLHPCIGMGIGHRWSLNSRLGKGITTPFLGEDKEDLFIFAKNYPKSENIDYFIFGHRHLPLTYQIDDKSQLVILGDWIKSNSYAIWDGETLQLKND